MEKNKFRKDSLVTGFELELENFDTVENDVVADRITEAVGPGLLYYKRDGSLRTGFEIVTHPFSWEWYCKNRETFKTMMDTAVSNGMRANERCGLHVHMNKKAFTYGHLYKFVKFIYSTSNRPFIIEFSRRGRESSFASFSASDTNHLTRYAKAKTNVSHERHSAVNATGGATVEVRFFQGTHDFPTFCAVLEFVYAVYEYTKNCSYKELMVDDWLNWLGQREVGNQYRHLITFLNTSVLSETRKRKFKLALKKNHVNLNTTKKGA
jgi:hypothetical protein